METKHPNSKDPKHFVSWESYHKLVEELAREIKQSGKQYRYIYGVPRGGLILAIIISHLLDIPLIVGMASVADQKETLVVEDLVDTGETLKYYKQFHPESDIAVLFVKSWASCKPTYYVATTKDWIVFPYEKQSELVSKEHYQTRLEGTYNG